MAHRWLLVVLLLSVTSAAARAQDPTGAEFQVNSYTTSAQLYPAVASDTSGNFVVVWGSYGQDGSGWGVSGQRFNAAGLRQGSEFQINSYITGTQLYSAVASDTSGNFVVVWDSDGQDGSLRGVFGQRFNAGGVRQGSEFQVNSYTTGYQVLPAVAADANGNYVVVWQSFGQDGNSSGIVGQRFNATGARLGSEFQVNSSTVNDQLLPSVAANANGDFVVVWQSSGQDGSGAGVFAQRFHAPLGTPLGSEFQVNTYTTGNQDRPKVALDAAGNFIAVWQSVGQDGSLDGVFGQRFNASAVPVGSEFQANTYAAGNQSKPTVASDANGDFAVAWVSDAQDGDGLGVFGQRFDAGGLPEGPEFQSNTYTTSLQDVPAVASTANRDFVVAWQSYGQDGSAGGIFGQRYGDLIFENGFE